MNLPFEYRPADLAADPSIRSPCLEAIAIQVFSALTSEYPPPTPPTTDSKHNENREGDAEGITIGLYHFEFW